MRKSKDIYDYLSDRDIKVWDQAQDCNCSVLDCAFNHKRCALCGETVIFGAYEKIQPNSRYNWNIDHKIPKAKFNSLVDNLSSSWNRIQNINDLVNLQITHVYCNSYKEDKFNDSYPNGYGVIKNPYFV